MIKLTDDMRECLFKHGIYGGARFVYRYDYIRKIVYKYDKRGVKLIEMQHLDLDRWAMIKDYDERSKNA